MQMSTSTGGAYSLYLSSFIVTQSGSVMLSRYEYFTHFFGHKNADEYKHGWDVPGVLEKVLEVKGRLYPEMTRYFSSHEKDVWFMIVSVWPAGSSSIIKVVMVYD